MTVNELKKAIETARQTAKTEKHLCKSEEKEIMKATYTKKADLEKQLETFKAVAKRHEERKAKTEKEKADQTKAVASIKKPTEKKATEKKAPKKTVKAEPEKELYPAKYDTNTMKLEKVNWSDDTLELLEKQHLIIGRFFDVKKITKSNVYSVKEPEINDALKNSEKSPFIENIDLYTFVNKNQFLYIMQSLITESFNSMRKDVLQKAVEGGEIALYKYTMKPQKKTTTRKATTKK